MTRISRDGDRGTRIDDSDRRHGLSPVTPGGERRLGYNGKDSLDQLGRPGCLGQRSCLTASSHGDAGSDRSIRVIRVARDYLDF